MDCFKIFHKDNEIQGQRRDTTSTREEHHLMPCQLFLHKLGMILYNFVYHLHCDQGRTKTGCERR